jgi:hypothetical protein
VGRFFLIFNFDFVKCGMDASNGVPRVARAFTESRFSLSLIFLQILFSVRRSRCLKLAQSLLYDTLVHNFWKGYTGGAFAADTDLHRAGKTLIELAIVVMANFIA